MLKPHIHGETHASSKRHKKPRSNGEAALVEADGVLSQTSAAKLNCQSATHSYVPRHKVWQTAVLLVVVFDRPSCIDIKKGALCTRPCNIFVEGNVTALRTAKDAS